jgi:hypothetical protein
VSRRLHRQCRYAAHLIAIRGAAVIFPPLRFLRIAEEIRPGDVVVNADFGASQAAEVFLSHVGASAIEAVW